MRLIQRLFWRASTLVSFLLGLIGIPLPGLPTVPFILLSAWCASRGWPQFDQWLVNHPRWGHHIVKWRTQGIVARKAKWLATLMILMSGSILWWSQVSRLLVVLLTIGFLSLLTWLWYRPEHLKEPS